MVPLPPYTLLCVIKQVQHGISSAKGRGDLGRGPAIGQWRGERGVQQCIRGPAGELGRTDGALGRKDEPREELVAAAHASCYCMALSSGLAKAGTPAERLQVSATVTFGQVEGGWKVAPSALTVTGAVPGTDDAAFQKAAEAATKTAARSRAPSRATSPLASPRRWSNN